ncbi:hypothetical protein SDRG_10352 [Saprolegnia diclina VS20]|uniref:Uncharacterized protein n=1 Tax=Saprolegnia diclina (strain VS20) TaxID=1156394 RepID=T0RQ50_SAPDV|nr:hypothetical protein SDRG_10352 [Saprolegnia diclina VS20]EQC32157.1 hypothetical protein SDRG_10352 [Saprolegnia diclina VS20]|eukprot:XP_008614559.1 hypothetical protein SDRG_10352 [Saprolegnia diclina VS20]
MHSLFKRRLGTENERTALMAMQPSYRHTDLEGILAQTIYEYNASSHDDDDGLLDVLPARALPQFDETRWPIFMTPQEMTVMEVVMQIPLRVSDGNDSSSDEPEDDHDDGMDANLARARTAWASNARCRNRDGVYEPVPKTIPGNKRPVFAPPDFVVPSPSAVGTVPAGFPRSLRSVFRLTKATIASLACFYNNDFGISSADVGREKMQRCFLDFIQGKD